MFFKRGLTLIHIVVFLTCVCPQALSQETRSPQRKKVWTNDDLKQLSQQETVETGKPSLRENSSEADRNEPYSREIDPKWYFRQLEPLRQELTTVQNNLRALLDAKRSGKTGTAAVDLDNEEAGATTDGEIYVLERRRDDLRKRIEDLEDQGRRNDIPPGQMRENAETRRWSLESEESNSSRPERQHESEVVRELQSRLAEDKKRLAEVDKEVDLLRREQQLEEQKEFSKPETQQRSKSSESLVKIGDEIVEKDSNVQGLQERIARLEDQIEDTKRHPSRGPERSGTLTSGEFVQGTREEEPSWRKQFEDVDYKIAIARKELDILQREHNVLLLQYYANPATAMKESVTRRDINNHRAAVGRKQQELTELKKQREDLEDALRHAGGPWAWAR